MNSQTIKEGRRVLQQQPLVIFFDEVGYMALSFDLTKLTPEHLKEQRCIPSR